MPYIPFGYLAGFLRFVHRNRDRVETLTYRDLPWGDDWDAVGGYPREAAAWKRSLESGERDPAKVYLLLQHDVDAVPERTMAALRLEEELGLRSSVMIFNRRVDREHYRDTGELRYSDYIGDRSYLKSLEAKGFAIGYHCNAYERSGFSRPEAARIVQDDIADLGRDFALEFMSAHGGPPGPDGKSNSALELPPALRRRVRWVHNGCNIFVDGGYSDGAINSPKRPAEDFDLRRFVERLRPGRRYRVLVHPQYYAQKAKRNARLASAWYEEVLEAYEGAARRDAWEGVRLGAALPAEPPAGRHRLRERVRTFSRRARGLLRSLRRHIPGAS
jgi:hypothetical protein